MSVTLDMFTKKLITIELFTLVFSKNAVWPDSNITKDYDDFDGAPLLKTSFHQRATDRLAEYLLKKYFPGNF